ncbi:DUF3658 domain-containing protein [Nocardia crassostreae]|uniref:DUF3658 domain-containing protein n=1 Tax=Nocardia crassostreae TaxID=53428 RepID=UPI000830E085|nr:DUF3658 domain-containing protein [Nocardia crassostreae]
MDRLHLTSGPSAAGALRVALSTDPAHSHDTVLEFPDSLAIGPLRPEDSATRAAWWRWWDEMAAAETGEDISRSPDLPRELTDYWAAVDSAENLVVWFSRDNATELSMFHQICDTLADRSFDVVEIPVAVAAQYPEKLAESLSGTRSITASEHAAARRNWRKLVQENQTFRIVTESGLTSAPADHYDNALLAAAGPDPTIIARVVAPVMADMNVADAPLFWRVQSLIESGALIADGNPWLARKTKVRRAP